MAKGVNPVKHTVKKEIKEDKLVTTYFEARNYWKKNYQNILKIGGVVLALIILLSFWTSSKKSSEYKASYELGIAMMKTSQGNPESTSSELEQIADRFSGTAAGNEALLFAAQTERLSDQNEEALKAYETYIRKGRKDAYLYPAALLGKAACLEDLGKFEEAAETYLAAASANRGLFVAPRFHIDAARCFRLAGQPEKAKQNAQYVLDNYPDSPSAQEAEKESKRNLDI